MCLLKKKKCEIVIKVKIIDIKVEIRPGKSLEWEFENCDSSSFLIKQNQEEILFKQTKQFFLKKVNLSFLKTPKLKIKILNNIENINIEAENGYISLKDLIVEKAIVSMKNGKIDLENIEDCDIVIYGNNGMLSVKNIFIDKECVLKLENGMMDLKNIMNDDFGYEISCESGISSIFNHKFSKEKVKIGSPFYKIKCKNGILKVKK